jgi:hypothetical protein
MDKIREEFKDDKEILDDISHIKTCSKRKTSPYQEFVGVCLRSGKSIKECAAEWRKKKGE